LTMLKHKLAQNLTLLAFPVWISAKDNEYPHRGVTSFSQSLHGNLGTLHQLGSILYIYF
jgi:hypothetical protein